MLPSGNIQLNIDIETAGLFYACLQQGATRRESLKVNYKSRTAPRQALYTIRPLITAKSAIITIKSNHHTEIMPCLYQNDTT
jgi:hypothetical protein